MASSSTTPEPSSFTTIMAFRGNGFALMASEGFTISLPYLKETGNDEEKTFKVCENAYMGVAGSSFCQSCVEPSVPFFLANHLPNPTSIDQVAHFIIGIINNTFASDWHKNGNECSILFMGNIPFSDSIEIYRFNKEYGGYQYQMSKVRRIKCVGTGASKLVNQVQNMPNNMTDEEAHNYAYGCIQHATQKDWCSGGKIKIVMIYLHSHPSGSYSRISTYAQSNPAKCDSPYEPKSDITVSYLEAHPGPPQDDDDDMDV